MSLGGTILQMVPLFPPNKASIEFSKPWDNGIRIISPDYLIQAKTKYYGDEITLGFWKLLNLPFGSTPSPSNPLTLQSGYKYIYNHRTRVFDVYDDTDTNILHTTNILTIVDLNIDFTIHKSHQFEIIVGDDFSGSHFIFPAKLVKKLFDTVKEDTGGMGLDNMWVFDNYNSSWDFPKYLAFVNIVEDVGFLTTEPIPIYIPGNYADAVGALNKYKDIFFERNRPMNYFLTRYSPEVFVKLLQTFDFKMLTGDLLLPWLSTDMYPDLMPVQRTGETQNNRPVYEPWMIWACLYLIYLRCGRKEV